MPGGRSREGHRAVGWTPRSSGVWRLLGLAALGPAEVAALVAERLPEVAPARLRADAAGLFDALAAVGLIERAVPS